MSHLLSTLNGLSFPSCAFSLPHADRPLTTANKQLERKISVLYLDFATGKEITIERRTSIYLSWKCVWDSFFRFERIFGKVSPQGEENHETHELPGFCLTRYRKEENLLARIFLHVRTSNVTHMVLVFRGNRHDSSRGKFIWFVAIFVSQLDFSRWSMGFLRGGGAYNINQILFLAVRVGFMEIPLAFIMIEAVEENMIIWQEIHWKNGSFLPIGITLTKWNEIYFKNGSHFSRYQRSTLQNCFEEIEHNKT